MIKNSSYAKRRHALAKNIPHPTVIAANTQMQAKADMAFPFVQDANFLYLTGIDEPDWVLFWDLKEWALVEPSISDTHALFEGSLAVADAKNISGVNKIITSTQYVEALEYLSKQGASVATIGVDPHKKYYDFTLNPATQKNRKLLTRYFAEVLDCRKELNKQRAIKTSEELLSQKKAIALTTDTFLDIKSNLQALEYEYEIEAQLSHGFRVHGSNGHAYSPIVAGGAHACTLHCSKNQAPLPKNGLVLIDAGTQVEGYTADITRTFAVGRPTERQVEVHAAVQKAHHAIIALIKPGLRFESYQLAVDDIMKDALMGLGLLGDRLDQKTYRKYFPHAISHGLGIDVHESLGGYDSFKEGMVFTIEPGIYIPEESIGVRIEDNILVTNKGHENLSKGLSTEL